MKSTIPVLLASCAGLLSLPSVEAQECAPVAEGARRVVAGDYVVTFVTEPRDISVGAHFDVRVAACRDGKPFAGGIGVDADMPGHGHGMNYTPAIVPTGEGRARAEGLMFHMPGEWRFLFTLDGASGREVLEATTDVR